MTKAEHSALKNLRKDKDCIIVTADKDEALVVMDKIEYVTKCQALLQYNSVYQHLSKDTSPTIHKELIKILQDYKNNNFISATEYTLLSPHDYNYPAARFYDLLKIQRQHAYTPHGLNLWHSNIQHCQILHNYCDKTLSFVKDSTDFIQKIKHCSINPEEETLVSFDVSALFSSIPAPVALQVVNSEIFTCTSFTSVCKIPTEKFIKLLEFTVINYICFNKKFYKHYRV